MSKYDTRKLIKENLQYFKGKVLDLGCGNCKYKSLVLENGENYIGADFYQHENVDVYTDAKETPFSDGEFDTIMCLQVLEHIKEPHKVIKECYRILKKEGYIILTTPWLYPFHGEPDDFFRFSRKALEFLFTNEGFNIIKIESRGGKFRVLSGFLRKFIKNKFLNKKLVNFFDFLDDIFCKSKDNLNTPSHLVIAKK